MQDNPLSLIIGREELNGRRSESQPRIWPKKIESCVKKACAGTFRMTSDHENKLTCVIWTGIGFTVESTEAFSFVGPKIQAQEKDRLDLSLPKMLRNLIAHE